MLKLYITHQVTTLQIFDLHLCFDLIKSLGRLIQLTPFIPGLLGRNHCLFFFHQEVENIIIKFIYNYVATI